VPNELVFTSASIICGQSSISSQNNFSGIATGVSLFAALGIGSIIAALISRWNSVSQLRQAWVDALRAEIADFFDAVEKVSQASVSQLIDLRTKRDAAILGYRKIALRLNMREASHRVLARRLEALLTVGRTIDVDRIDNAIVSAKRVLKAEWDRTKYGPFLPIVAFYKARRRLRALAKERRRRRRSSTT